MDLRITDDSLLGRPAVGEIGVRIANRGDTAGDGRLSVDIVNDVGGILLQVELPPQKRVIRVPGYWLGGREGTAVRLPSNSKVKALLDSLTRAGARFGMRATVEALGSDVNPSDNSKTVEWNGPLGFEPGKTYQFPYEFRSQSTGMRRVQWKVETSPRSVGWSLQGLPTPTAAFWWAPAEATRGTLVLRTPARLPLGKSFRTRLVLIDAVSGDVVQEHEWFLVYDTLAPLISNYRLVALHDHRLAIQVFVGDRHSGVWERGVSTQFSADRGRTWQQTRHRYVVDEFGRPAVFEAFLGPFVPNSTIWLRLTALDNAGNANTSIPLDAAGFVAPQNSELLINGEELSLPQDEPSRVFNLEKLARVASSGSSTVKRATDSGSLSPDQADVVPRPARSRVGTEQRRQADLATTRGELAKLGIDMTSLRSLRISRVPFGAVGGRTPSTIELTIPD